MAVLSPDATPETRVTDDPILVTLTGGGGDDVIYTLDGRVPSLTVGIRVASGTIITIPNQHTLLHLITVDGDDEISAVVRFQYPIDVEIVLHPQKTTYEFNDILTATLNALSGGDIQTFEEYRWRNEQVEHRFDQQEDDDLFMGPRPEFRLNKIGKFRVRVNYKDAGFAARREDKLFEVFPKLRVKYKGILGEIPLEELLITESNIGEPILGDEAGELPINEDTGRAGTSFRREDIGRENEIGGVGTEV